MTPALDRNRDLRGEARFLRGSQHMVKPSFASTARRLSIARIAVVIFILSFLLAVSGCGSVVGSSAQSRDPVALTGKLSRPDERNAIIRALRAPLVAFISRNPQSLCSAFIASVAARLVAGSSNCDAGAARVFSAQHGTIEHYGPKELPSGLKVSLLSLQKGRATVESTWPWPSIRYTVRVTLEKSGVDWRIATTARLVRYMVCGRPFGAVSCSDWFGIEFGPGPTTRRLTPG
jgi:hypothetical protein